MQEIETKILEVKVDEIKQKMFEIGAEKLQDTRLSVDWFKAKEHQGENYPWYLRIRTDSAGNSEVTWKGKREYTGVASTKKEINLKILDVEACADLFREIGLELYGHQEKDRISWRYKNWRFDLDTYPNMPSYVEIEGDSEEDIRKAIEFLGLGDKTATPQGERDVISKIYKLDWYNMRF